MQGELSQEKGKRGNSEQGGHRHTSKHTQTDNGLGKAGRRTSRWAWDEKGEGWEGQLEDEQDGRGSGGWEGQWGMGGAVGDGRGSRG